MTEAGVIEDIKIVGSQSNAATVSGRTTASGSLEQLAVIAGNGLFPHAVIRAAQTQGRNPLVIGYREESDPELSTLARNFSQIRVGQIGKLLTILRRNNVKEIIFIGGINKARLLRSFRPDLTGLRLMRRLIGHGDDQILRTVAKFFEEQGIRVIGAAELLPEWIPTPGILGAIAPTAEQSADIELGWKVAESLGALDIGQAVVIKRGVVIAVEAVEGTDKLLSRLSGLGAEGGILVKRCKPHQDRRMDLPSIGLQTIELMSQAGLSALAVEAGATLLLDPSAVGRRADQMKIALLAR